MVWNLKVMKKWMFQNDFETIYFLFIQPLFSSFSSIFHIFALFFSRSSAGFVGLKNGGATCYMNSVLQQLFMTPGLVEAVLSVEDTTEEDDTVLFQLQTVLGHLLESKLQYYVPEKFWKVGRISFSRCHKKLILYMSVWYLPVLFTPIL